MRYYSEDLQRLQQEILEKKRTKAKLSDLQIQQAELKERTAKLEKLMVKEQKDVDRLNRGSLSAFFYRASGQMEEKLSKEEEEAQYQELIQRFLQHSAITPDEKK